MVDSHVYDTDDERYTARLVIDRFNEEYARESIDQASYYMEQLDSILQSLQLTKYRC